MAVRTRVVLRQTEADEMMTIAPDGTAATEVVPRQAEEQKMNIS
jgi:hypothetical protein